MLVEPPPEARAESSDSAARLLDVAALKVILTGESVVDSANLPLADRDAVDRFLRLQQFDTDNPLDLARLMALHEEAIEYLSEIHKLRIPMEVESISQIHDLFLLAMSGSPETRRSACVTLKVMHILHHINGHELVFNTPLSEAQLLERVSARVFAVIDDMRANGVQVLEFSAGKKTRGSLVTKLLAKRSTLASQVFDKLRFGITVKSRGDLVRTLAYLSRHLFPFNYVVPGQSQNGILTIGDIAGALALDAQAVWDEWTRGRAQPVNDGAAPTPPNEFSGSTYRCVNFVVDIPLRIDDVAPALAPAIAFVKAEIQLVDEETDRQNNQGENSHTRYKKRQYQRVRARLEGVPEEEPN